MLTSEAKEKKIAEHYLKTNVFGAYETAHIVWDEEEAGKYAPCFDDALIVFHPDQTSMERTMVVDGKRFRVHSLFAADADFTSTDKLLGFIDSELEKETAPLKISRLVAANTVCCVVPYSVCRKKRRVF